MSQKLEDYATTIIACAELLLRQQDGSLNDKQLRTIKTIIASAEQFIHIYAACQAMSISDFVANMRHEVGNPLTPIRGYSELLLMGALGGLNDTQLESVKEIADTTVQLQSGVEAMVRGAREQLAAMSSA